MPAYRHTQPGYLIMVLVGAALAYTLFLTVATNFDSIVVLVDAVLVAALIVFSSLTVEVDKTTLTVWFGQGVARWHIPLRSIKSVRTVYNPWYYAWGIHWIPWLGWIYNVSGTAGVELLLESGSRFRIGSDKPEALAQALAARGVEYPR
ncbi:MAG: hypothetical protein ACYC4L_12130 [Chloroflexota bacterium]